MQKAVNNLTDASLSLGGVEIKAKSQRMVRESLVTDEEKQAISKLGAVLTVKFNEITVAVKEEENVTAVFENVVYPAELIKKDGTLNGQPALKADIEALDAKYGEAILNEVDFKAKYPDVDIEAHRAEVGE